jgi:hypothetical protein
MLMEMMENPGSFNQEIAMTVTKTYQKIKIRQISTQKDLCRGFMQG